MAINYVKFQRGPQSAYESLKALGKIDPNTLYFIYSQDDSNTTSLYMGESLIIGGNSSSINLNDLKDVIITNANENSFLVKNANEQWISKSLEDVVNLIQQNFTDNTSIEVVDGVIQLKDFGKGYYKYISAEKDESGEIITPSRYEYIENQFIAGLEPRVILNTDNNLEIAWYEPSNETIDGINSKIESISNTVEILQDQVQNKANAESVYTKTQTDLAIAEAVANADHLKRKIVTSIDDIDKNAEDALSYIYMVPSASEKDSNKYDEYLVIEISTTNEITSEIITERVLEKVGSWQVDLSDYVMKSELKALSLTDKLEKINLKENGDAEFIGKINVSNINGLDTWITDNKLNYITSVEDANFIVENGQLKLNANNGRLITNDEINTLQAVTRGDFNFIKSVNEDIFSVNSEGKLDLVAIPSSLLEPVIGDMTKLINYTEGSSTTIVNELNNIYNSLIWKDVGTE